MPSSKLWRRSAARRRPVLRCLALLAYAVGLPALGTETTRAVPPLDLATPFRTRSPWRLVVTEGPPTSDYGGNPAPGELHLCLQKRPADPCVAGPVSTTTATDRSNDWAPHELRLAKPVYPQGRAAPPLLEIVTGSLHAGDGGQQVVTQLLRYDPARDGFERIFFDLTGSNNNQEVRFIADGPLRGEVISADPTSDAPFGYWIEVRRLTASRRYRRVLRYRSATRYGDGNTLAVIDSEMPNIESRLGLWRPGTALPLPASASKPCPRPRLKRMELWCE